MKSSLYFGEVRHHRRSPKKHDLCYKLFMAHLFLDELPEVFKGRWLWSVDRPNLSAFRRKDYHDKETSSLEKAVRSTMTEQLGRPIEGPISILTHLRTFGYCFNPISFYYAWDEAANLPHAIMTEITNTPWGERYAKVFSWDDSDEKANETSKHEFKKEFHVSPFIGMDVRYDWRFSSPAETLRVDMILREMKEVFFTAHLNLRRKKITSGNLAWALMRFPFLTLSITAQIYWNAILLRLKGCPFHSHPKHSANTTSHGQASN
jgi:DUF1365 family protein